MVIINFCLFKHTLLMLLSILLRTLQIYLWGAVSFIWIMYWENKQVQTNFIWDTYVHKLWWYGSWPQAWKILDDENHKIWNAWVAKEVVCATKDSQGYLEANPERKNYWLIFKNNGSRSRIWNEHRLRYSNSQYDIASILLL